MLPLSASSAQSQISLRAQVSALTQDEEVMTCDDEIISRQRSGLKNSTVEKGKKKKKKTTYKINRKVYHTRNIKYKFARDTP